MKVELKKWSYDDIDDLVKVMNNSDRTYLSNSAPYPFTQANAKWWLDHILKQDEIKGIYRSIVVDDEIVGNISVILENDVFSIDSELGYLLMKNQWNKGIMSDAVCQIVKLAFYKLDIQRITALVFDKNIASKRVLEKNGFILEGIKKNAVKKNNQIFDLFLYGKYINTMIK
jgi:ribosomal-protein-alanine N-acetyltransferase